MAKQGFSQQDIRKKLDRALNRIDQAILRRLQYLGEQLVNHARENGSYLDQTGNLRSSLAYVILKNGSIIMENYKSVKGASEGVKKAKEYADTLQSRYPKGYCLLLVAGMNYAQAVEVLRGRNVLSITEMEAKSLVPQMIAELKLNIKRMKV